MNTSTHLPRRSLFALAAMVPALLTACSAVDLLNATVPTDTYRRTADISYGAHPRQKVDVYQPLSPSGAPGNLGVGQTSLATVGTGKPPLVVFFYGGSWSSGDRADYRFVGEALASKGIVVVLADYRLSPEFRYPTFVQDSASAVRWAVDHAAEYGADPARVFVMGHSAGGYNAAMLALDKRWLGAVGLSPARLAGWIGLAGPYDFLPIDDKKTQVAFNWPDTPQDSQPLMHASRASPPALLIAPRDDKVVSATRSTVAMADKLKSAGVPVESALFDGVSHVTLIASLAPVLRSRSEALERIVAFVARTPAVTAAR